MMLVNVLAAVLVGALAIRATASPLAPKRRDIPATHTLHERSLPHWKHTWARTDKVDAEIVLPIRIGLRQSNLEVGHERLLDMHFSSEEVIDLFAPAQTSVDRVREWLIAAGIAPETVSQSANKQWIQFDATVGVVEDLLLTDYYIYEHGPTGTQNVACDKYHVPKEIREHIDYITPGIRLRQDPNKRRRARSQLEVRSIEAHSHGKRGFLPSNTGSRPVAQPEALKGVNDSVCYEYVTNSCIRRQYQIPLGTTAAPGNELGIFESLDQHYTKEDLDVYWSTLFPAIPNGTYPTEDLIDGAIGAAQTAADDGLEANLDFEAAWPLIWPQKTVLFQSDDQFYEINQTLPNTTYLGFYNTFLDAIDGSYCTYSAYGETGDCTAKDCLDPSYPDPNPGGYKGQLQCGVYKPTNVISVSYSGGEYDLPVSYTKRQCSEIMKLGLQGITVVMSAGDYGVGSYPGDDNLVDGCTGPTGRVFYPQSDSTCPYVLSVGSTEFDVNPKTNSSCNLIEVATKRFPSGGGFSNYFDVPTYQQQAVQAYFSEVQLSFSGYTNPGNNFSAVGNGVYKIGGRGYPDVSAIGDNFVVRDSGQWGLVGGTSLAAPVWAAVLTRLNEARLAAGKKPIGFVNQILYTHPEVLNDITEGSNPNCNSTGFLAARGWDPVTGLGSPNYPKMLELFLSLP